MNKQVIITVLLALIAVVGTSDTLDFCINYKDVAIAVNKNIAGNQVPDEETAVGEATLTVRFLETEGGHVDIILVAAGAWNAEAEHLHHRNPVASGLGHLLGHALLPLKGGHMRLASSRLRFM